MLSQKAYTNTFMLYRGLIKDRVNFFHKSNLDLEYEDLEAQANFVFCKAYIKFNPERNIAFSTYLWTTLNNELSQYIYKEKKQLHFESLEHYTPTNNFKENMLQEQLSNLPIECQEVITTVLTAPIEVIRGKKTKITKESLKNYFVQYKGWSRYKYEQCVIRIQGFLLEFSI